MINKIKCPKCSNIITSNKKFCAYCGYKIPEVKKESLSKPGNYKYLPVYLYGIIIVLAIIIISITLKLPKNNNSSLNTPTPEVTNNTTKNVSNNREPEEKPKPIPSKNKINIQSGLIINLTCNEPGNKISENYKCIVRIEDVKPSKIHYKWWENYPTGKVQTGDWVMTNLNSSRNYNSWWHNGEYKYTEDTAPWISKSVFKELKKHGKSILNIDVDGRGDRNLQIYLDKETDFSLLIDNKPENLNILLAYTDKGDKLKILNDPENPLVISANISKSYNWYVTSISGAVICQGVKRKKYPLMKNNY